MLNIDSHRPIHAPDAASRVYGTDAVVISPEEGMVRLLNLTATRIWELAAGALTGVLLSQRSGVLQTLLTNKYIAVAISIAGFIAIGISVLYFDNRMAFPGWVALIPVLGKMELAGILVDREKLTKLSGLFVILR